MNPTVSTIRQLFGSAPASGCAMDAREYKRGGNPKNPGQFSKGGGAASGSKAAPAKSVPKKDASAQAFVAGKAQAAKNAVTPKKPTKSKAKSAKAPKEAAKADVTVSANSMRSRAMANGKEIGFVTGEIKNGALCIHKSTLSSKEHGKGYGVAMYKALVDKALERGLRVESDWEPTEQAARMYDALERRGYAVERRAAGQKFTHKPFAITAGPNARAKTKTKKLPAEAKGAPKAEKKAVPTTKKPKSLQGHSVTESSPKAKPKSEKAPGRNRPQPKDSETYEDMVGIFREVRGRKPTKAEEDQLARLSWEVHASKLRAIPELIPNMKKTASPKAEKQPKAAKPKLEASTKQAPAKPKLAETEGLLGKAPMRIIDLHSHAEQLGAEAREARMSNADLDAKKRERMAALSKAQASGSMSRVSLESEVNRISRVRAMKPADRKNLATQLDEKHAKAVSAFNEQFGNFSEKYKEAMKAANA
jgi:hypothetical protein